MGRIYVSRIPAFISSSYSFLCRTADCETRGGVPRDQGSAVPSDRDARERDEGPSRIQRANSGVLGRLGTGQKIPSNFPAAACAAHEKAFGATSGRELDNGGVRREPRSEEGSVLAGEKIAPFMHQNAGSLCCFPSIMLSSAHASFSYPIKHSSPHNSSPSPPSSAHTPPTSPPPSPHPTLYSPARTLS
jgi:hypothetical protein